MTGAWVNKPWLALDFETTGVNPFADRIVQYACLLIDPVGALIDGDGDIVNPGVPIPDGAAAIHGITTEQAVAEGCEPARGLSGIADLLAEHRTSPLVIYNAAFDWPMLLMEATRHGVEILPPAGILDPLVIDKQIAKRRRGGRKLAQVAEHYGVPLGDKAHGAKADALAAAGIMRAIVDRRPDIAERSLVEMTLWQTAAAEEQRQEFTDYMRRNRDPGFHKPAGWPIPGERAA